jgi:competence protein ComEC
MAFLWTLSIAFFCVSLGFGNAKIRTISVAQPSLERSGGFGIFKSWVEKTEMRLERGHRIILRPYNSNSSNPPLPYRVRYTSRFKPVPLTGSAIEVRLRLRPVPEPVMPGGFYFSRKAFYAGLGAVGFAVAPSRLLPEAPMAPLNLRMHAKLDKLCHGIKRRILETIPGERGAVVIALITGERGLIPEETLQALRNSGLAQMLAISGLHMALMAGSLFWLLRAGAAAFPALALRYPIK